MTMSGVNTEASAPLDLRTTTRTITDRTTRQTRTQVEDRTPKSEEVKCTSKGSPSLSVAIEADSKACKDILTTVPSKLKCEGLAVKCGKSPESSTSKLPIRKRPVRPEHKPPEQAESTGLEPPVKILKTDLSPNTATVSKCIRVNSEFNAETQQMVLSPAPVATHREEFQPSPSAAYCTYTHHHLLPYTPRHSFEDDRLRYEVDLATHQDEDGDTALHIAVAQEKEPVIYCLIHILCQARKDLDLYNNLRQTPLHLAVITHQPRVVKALLQGGADPGALDRNGQTALHLCCEHQQDVCLHIILSHLSRLPSFPSDCLNIRNFEGLTPLHLTVQDGNKKLAKMLLDSGADINAVDIKSGRSPLIHAVEKSCIEMINFLLENGCNVNSQSYSGNTALHIACGRGEVDAVRLLLKNGADSSLKNYHNDTAVMVAKNKKVSDVLRGKPSRGHNLKTQNSFNGTTSPNHLSLSPLATPNPHRSASLSPTAPHTYSPQSQSGDSRSGNLSPVEMQEYEYVLPIYSFIQSPCYDPHMHLMTGHSTYHPNFVQRQPYPSDTKFILIPPRNRPVSLQSLSQSTGMQSRPSSHNSDQSDISNLSTSTGEKT